MILKTNIVLEKRDLHPAYIQDFSCIQGLSFQQEYNIYIQGKRKPMRCDFKISYKQHSILSELKVFNKATYHVGEHLSQLLAYYYSSPNVDWLMMGTQNNITLININENKDVLKQQKPIFDMFGCSAPSRFCKDHPMPIADFVRKDFEINESFEMKSVFDFILSHA